MHFHAVGFFFHQTCHWAFDIGLFGKCGLGVGNESFALGRILGIGGRSEQGFAVFFQNIGGLDRLLGSGHRLGHFHHQRAEVHAGRLEVVDGFAEILQRLGVQLTGGSKCGVEPCHEWRFIGRFGGPIAQRVDQLLALGRSEVRGGGKIGEGLAALRFVVGAQHSEHAFIATSRGSGIVEDQIAGRADLFAEAVVESGGFLRASQLGKALAIDLGLIGAIEQTRDLLVGGEIFARDIDKLESCDAIHFQLAAVTRKETQALAKKENNDQQQNENCEPGIRSKEEPDRPLKGKTLSLKAVATGFGGWIGGNHAGLAKWSADGGFGQANETGIAGSATMPVW